MITISKKWNGATLERGKWLWVRLPPFFFKQVFTQGSPHPPCPLLVHLMEKTRNWRENDNTTSLENQMTYFRATTAGGKWREKSLNRKNYRGCGPDLHEKCCPNYGTATWHAREAHESSSARFTREITVAPCAGEAELWICFLMGKVSAKMKK